MGKPIALSYSAIKQFNECPAKFHHLRIARTVKDEGSTATQRGSEIHKHLELAIAEDTPLPRHLTHAQVLIDWVRSHDYYFAEQQLCFDEGWNRVDWFGPDAWFRGIIDVLCYNGGEPTLKVVDWKTGKRRLDVNQVRIFGMAALLTDDQAERVEATYIWLDQKKHDTMYVDRDDISLIQQEIEEKSDEVQYASDRNIWPERPGRHCRWCPAKNICPKGA